MVDVELLQELRGLRAAIERLPAEIAAALAGGSSKVQKRPLRKADVDRLARLLPLIFQARRGTVFFMFELWSVPMAKAEPEAQAALLAEIGPRTEAKRLGRLLARAEGWTIAGLTVCRAVRLREGQAWEVVAKPSDIRDAT